MRDYNSMVRADKIRMMCDALRAAAHSGDVAHVKYRVTLWKADGYTEAELCTLVARCWIAESSQEPRNAHYSDLLGQLLAEELCTWEDILEAMAAALALRARERGELNTGLLNWLFNDRLWSRALFKTGLINRRITTWSHHRQRCASTAGSGSTNNAALVNETRPQPDTGAPHSNVQTPR